MNITSKTLMTMAAAMAITLTGWAKTLPGVAPMAPDQLAQWRAEETLVNAPKATAKSDLAFYTGKPYDADLNAYVFPFRNYNPDLCRWTVADPSGFPDGANNYCYAPTPNMGCDPWGLKTVILTNVDLGNNITVAEGAGLVLIATISTTTNNIKKDDICKFTFTWGDVVYDYADSARQDDIIPAGSLNIEYKVTLSGIKTIKFVALFPDPSLGKDVDYVAHQLTE